MVCSLLSKAADGVSGTRGRKIVKLFPDFDKLSICPDNTAAEGHKRAIIAEGDRVDSGTCSSRPKSE